MQVQSLEAFGVHRDLLRAWEDNYGKELLPVQAAAVIVCRRKPFLRKPYLYQQPGQ